MNMDPKKHEISPPFPEQAQSSPGSETDMQPRPDHGEESYRGHGRLEGRVALITGGDSGIGRAVAIAFAREGADIAFGYLSDKEKRDAEETVTWIEKAGRRVVSFQADLSQDAGCEKLVRAAIEKFDRIDCLVNNASFQGKSVERFEDLDPERVRYTFASNVESTFSMTRYALRYMKEGGTIINSSSIQARDPSAHILDYACTKAAIASFTVGLSPELLKRGIRVNAVAPGPVWTPLIAQSFPRDKVAQFGKTNPMGRPAQPAELAPAYVFLASDESRFVTGEIVAVTGGRRFE